MIFYLDPRIKSEDDREKQGKDGVNKKQAQIIRQGRARFLQGFRFPGLNG